MHSKPTLVECMLLSVSVWSFLLKGDGRVAEA